jgi:hypothetical protein
MKKIALLTGAPMRSLALIAMLALAAMFAMTMLALVGCAMAAEDSIKGTVWEYLEVDEPVSNSGELLPNSTHVKVYKMYKFTTDTSGKIFYRYEYSGLWSAENKTKWEDKYESKDFTYTYSSQSGTRTIDGIQPAVPFTVDIKKKELVVVAKTFKLR